MIWLNNSWTSETANIIRFRVVRTAGNMTGCGGWMRIEDTENGCAVCRFVVLCGIYV